MFRLNIISFLKAVKITNKLIHRIGENPFLFHKIASMKKVFYILSISMLIISCNSKDDYIQDVYVNIDLDLNLAEYSELGISGNSIFIEGGVDGIIVYHGIGDDYKVYDRNCSYEPSLSCSYIDSINATVAYCSCCTSAFLLDQDGNAANAPAILPLKGYSYTLQNNMMHIFN